MWRGIKIAESLQIVSIFRITLWANLADDKLVIFFLFSPENRIWHFMQIVSIGDNLHELSNPVFWEKKEKYFKMSAAEYVT